LGAVETVRIVEELMEIWLNEVCDTTIIFLSHGDKVRLKKSEMGRGTRVQEPFIIIRAAMWHFFTLACNV